MHPIDITAILTRVAGLSILAADTTFQQSVTTLFGTHGTAIIAGIGFASILATDILRINGSPSGTAHVLISAVQNDLTVPNFKEIPPAKGS